MNKLTVDRRAAVIRGLVEGGSIRAVARMTGVDKDTVMRLLVEEKSALKVFINVASE